MSLLLGWITLTPLELWNLKPTVLVCCHFVMIALTTGHIILSQKLIRLYYLPAIFNSRFLSVDLPYDHQLDSKMTMPTCIASLWVKSRKKTVGYWGSREINRDKPKACLSNKMTNNRSNYKNSNVLLLLSLFTHS